MRDIWTEAEVMTTASGGEIFLFVLIIAFMAWAASQNDKVD